MREEGEWAEVRESERGGVVSLLTTMTGRDGFVRMGVDSYLVSWEEYTIFQRKVLVFQERSRIVTLTDILLYLFSKNMSSIHAYHVQFELDLV